MGLSALLYLLCSSKASKIDFLELGFRNWGCALLKIVWRWVYIVAVWEVDTAYRLGLYGVSGFAWSRDHVLCLDSFQNILLRSCIRRIHWRYTAYWSKSSDTAYMMGSYAVLVFTCPDCSSRCLIRRILQGYTAYRSWQRPECCIFVDLSPLSSSIRTFKQVSIFYSCIAALSLNKPYYTILQQ